MTPTMERLRTGVPGLDHALEGGFPVHSVTLIAGEPGSGKTVLALQTVFAAARLGKKCIYFTTLSEPALKLVRYMQGFDFFDEGLTDQLVAFHDLGTVLRSQDPEAALRAFTDAVERAQPDVVVIDSFKAVQDLVADPRGARALSYDLAVRVAAWGATALLVGEYSPAEVAASPEFAIADGILVLGQARQELATIRQLEVRKLRGSGYASGVHFFDIGPGGIAFYPRVRAPEGTDRLTLEASPEQISCGVRGLDELLRGGVPVGSTSVVMGGTGTGKTLLGLHFLLEGVRRGEPGALFTLEESPGQLRRIARGFGFDLAAYEQRGLLHITYVPPVELSTDRLFDAIRRVTKSSGIRRAVFDSLTSLALGAISERRYKEFVYALAKHFRAHDGTLLLTLEIAELLGSVQLSGHGVSFAADNVIQLRYVERRGRLDRAISIVKARGVDVLTELRALHIGGDGMRVGAAKDLAVQRGVISGKPTRRRKS